MSETTPSLGLPLMMPSQAQKHVTMNESLAVIDAAVQLSVVSRTEAEPVPGAVNGDRYIVPAAAIGAFEGQDGQLAWLDNGVWRFLTPAEGWRAWVRDTQALDVLTSSGWQSAGSTFGQVGINATPDTTNRLAVSSDAALFSHEGSDHRLKINRAGPGDIASLLFQTAFSSEAEFGLGAGGLALRTSSDGLSWQTRLVCPEEGYGVQAAAVRSGSVEVASDDVAVIQAPDTSGIFLFWNYDASYPDVHHSAIVLFDVGASLNLAEIFLGPNSNNAAPTLLTGTAGPAGKTSISVQSGTIQLENRRSSASIYRYLMIA